MDSADTISFLNGLVCGGSITLFLIALFFLKVTTSVDGIVGVTTTEIRFAIFASSITIAITAAYEIYRKAKCKKSNSRLI